MTAWPFSDLRMFGYDLIMADCPWRYENWSHAGEHKNASAKYTCMDEAALSGLPVGHLAAPDSLLWMWATNPMLDVAFRVMRSWGFTFKTAGTWVKKTSGGKITFGTGYVLRSANEPFLIGTIGEPKTSRSVRSVIEGPVREHSRKPDEAYRAAERLIPGARRADLFSRQVRAGWDAWGNETDKFAETAA